MPDKIACGVCGRAFAPRRNGPRRYCGPCRARAAREAARVHQTRCRACGKAFRTPSRAVRYCSDACRQRGYAASRNTAGPLRPHDGTAECRACGKTFRTPSRAIRYCSEPCREEGYARGGNASILRRPRPAPAAKAARCRVCGRSFETGGGPGKPRVYCSAACRAEGERIKNREAMRRYLADPKKRALHAARVSAAHSRRRAAAARERERRAPCGVCGREFTTVYRNALYCSNPCRKRASAEQGRRRRVLAGSPATARCRACSAEFEPGHGGGRMKVYCSRECQADGVRAGNREYVRRRYADPGGRAACVVDAGGGGAGAARSARAVRVRCRECGRGFSATSRAARYCSNLCWKKSRDRTADASRRKRLRRIRLAGRGRR